MSATGISAHDVFGSSGIVLVTIRSSGGQPFALSELLRSSSAASVMMLKVTPGEWSAIDLHKLANSRKVKRGAAARGRVPGRVELDARRVEE